MHQLELYSVLLGGLMMLLAVLSFDTVGSWANKDYEGVGLNANLMAYLTVVMVLHSTVGLAGTRGFLLLLVATIAYYTVKRTIQRNY